MAASIPHNFPAPQGPPVDAGEPLAAVPGSSGVAPPDNLLARAKANDSSALATMFAQFLPTDEPLIEGRYLGVLGFWGIGVHSFAGVTARRIVTLRLSLLGGVTYQEGALEYANSAVVYQPSKLTLYLYVAGLTIFAGLLGLSVHPVVAIVAILASLLLLPVTVRVYYRFKKSGLVVWVREGIAVYLFIDRKRMRIANQLHRSGMALREERLRSVGHP
jgi:hypothetical protein